MRQYVAFDLETTGLHAEHDRVVEIGAVRFDAEGRELARFESLVRPDRPMNPRARAIHGISDADLADAPRASEVLPSFIEFLGDSGGVSLLAHNASFDAGFLGSELARMDRRLPGHVVTDTLSLARARLPRLGNHRLDTLTKALGLEEDRPHRALFDSIRVKGIWLALRGHDPSEGGLVSYPIFNARSGTRLIPVGWGVVADAIDRGGRIRMEYTGGTRGVDRREITPHRFALRGGVPYLVAKCHLDGVEKNFRLDRVRWYEVIA